jgi:hypothetical protein
MANNLKIFHTVASNQPNTITCIDGVCCYFYHVADTSLQRHFGTSLSVQSKQPYWSSSAILVAKRCITFFRHAFGHESHGIYVLWTTATPNFESESLALVAACGRRCFVGIHCISYSGSRFVLGFVERYLGIPGSASQTLSGPTIGHRAGCISGSSTGASCLETVAASQRVWIV